MWNFLLRVVLFICGLLFAASLAVAALLLLTVWLLRMGWARLTGKPVTPWAASFGQRFDPRQGFDRFRAATGGRAAQAPTAADVSAARARGESSSRWLRQDEVDEVTDVRSRPVDGPL